jgi:Fic family protein
MYTPKFSYSDKVVQNLVKAERIRSSLENADLSYNSRFKLTNQAKAIDIFHIAHMLKVDMTISEAEKFIKTPEIEIAEIPKGNILYNFKNTLDFNRSGSTEVFTELDTGLILHLNKLMQHEWRETWEANLRSFNDQIDGRWDSFIGFVDNSIKPAEIADELDSLIEWYKYSIPSITPLVRIAIVFYRLIEIAPFAGANKFVTISIIDSLLYANGYGGKIYASIARTVDANEERFLKILEVVKRTHEISHFIDLFISCVSEDMSKTREIVNEFKIKEEKTKEQPFLDLNKRQLKIIKYLQTVPTIQREDYCHMMDVSTMTAFRDLKDLVRKKLIKLDGKGRGTKYKLASY